MVCYMENYSEACYNEAELFTIYRDPGNKWL